MSTAAYIPFLLLMLLAACATGQPRPPVRAADPVVDRGLQRTSRDRGTIERAAALANRVLSGSGYRIELSWKDVGAGVPDARRIPLYAVATRDDRRSTPASVPKDCRCIFVNPGALRAWISAHSRGVGRLRVDRINALAFMLLHEIGHIESSTSAVAYTHGRMSQLNVAPSLAKASEERADEFAAQVVRDASSAGPASEKSVAATQIAGELINLAWNLQAHRQLDRFGSTITNDPEVFFDPTYSHPNLEWRILRANHLIQGSPLSKQLLDAFEERRARSGNRPPIYQAE